MISVDTYAWVLACTRTVDVEDVVVQASYLFRQKLVLECEKRSVGRMIDLDSFLLFLVDFWHDEQHRVEERMRSLFVGADANADGNLDFEEFVKAVDEHNELAAIYKKASKVLTGIASRVKALKTKDTAEAV